jgi:hypothetical protein
MKVAAGGVDSPWMLTPQQTTVPSVLSAHVKNSPALTDVKVPWGGVDSPNWFVPQQTTVPSVLRPHVCHMPALTDVKSCVVVLPGELTIPGPASGMDIWGSDLLEQATTAAAPKMSKVL